MRRHRIVRTAPLVLLAALALAAGAAAQRQAPACALTPGALRDMVLPDSTYALVFPQEMVARHDSVLVLGTAGLTDARGNLLPRNGDNSIVGFLLTDHRRTVTAIHAPRGLPSARYFRVRAGDGGWDAAFFVPDRDTVPGARMFDDGVLWYARLSGSRWSDVEQIGRVDSAVVMRPNSSGLVGRDGELYFGLFYGEPTTRGGVLRWHRTRAESWRVDTLSLPWGPVSVTTAPDGAPSPDLRFFPVLGHWEAGEYFPGSLITVSASGPSEWAIVRRSLLESMNEPVELAVNDTLHVSWWQFGRGEPPSLWYQALDPRKENATEKRIRVARGVNEYNFLAVQDGARTRLVWAYRPSGVLDSAEVAVVANGEPEVVGRVAFPFGFMTNGVASGDGSFTLATTPRPVPDGEPSASRTLEVRVSCKGGT